MCAHPSSLRLSSVPRSVFHFSARGFFMVFRTTCMAQMGHHLLGQLLCWPRVPFLLQRCAYNMSSSRSQAVFSFLCGWSWLGQSSFHWHLVSTGLQTCHRQAQAQSPNRSSKEAVYCTASMVPLRVSVQPSSSTLCAKGPNAPSRIYIYICFIDACAVHQGIHHFGSAWAARMGVEVSHQVLRCLYNLTIPFSRSGDF
jgi:hypothetical protein